MLSSVVLPIIGALLVLLGLVIVATSIRIGLGSDEAYDQLRGTSKGFLNTMLGDTYQPKGKGGILFNRGVAYAIDKDGQIEIRSQAKTNRESVKDSSI